MIQVEDKDGVRRLTLAHGKANAFDLEFCGAVVSAVRDAERAGARALVVTGQGTIFSAGVDLLRLVAEGRAYVERFLTALDDAFETLFSTSLPVVAAINGHAIAGGCILAQCADHRVAAMGPQKIGVPELLVGVPFPILALEIMRFAAPACAQELLLFGKAVALEEAKAFGLADQVCAPEEVLARADAAARQLAAVPPQSFATTKRYLRAPVLARYRDAGESVRRALFDVWSAPEQIAAVKAYIDRTLKK